MNVNLSDRMTCMIVGVVIGFLLGYLTRYLQKRENQNRSEAGFLRLPTLADIKVGLVRAWRRIRRVRLRSWTMTLVVLICAIASFQTQHVNNDLRKNDKADAKQQTQIESITKCNSEFLGKTIVALNERTTYTVGQAKANVTLQKQQLDLLVLAFTLPPPGPQEGRAAFGKYIDKLNAFIELAKKTADKAQSNPYPTLDEFSNCVNKKETK